MLGRLVLPQLERVQGAERRRLRGCESTCVGQVTRPGALDTGPSFPLIGASVYFACSDSRRNRWEMLNQSNFGISPKRQIIILKIGAQPLK